MDEQLEQPVGIEVNMTYATIIALVACMLAGMGFFATCVYWIVNRMDKVVGTVKTELLLLRTNDLAHIYQELRDIRKERV